MKKLGLFLLAMMITRIAWADISISPFYVAFEADSPKRTEVVRFTNTGDQTKRYRINMVNYRQNADGSYIEIKEPLPGNPFAAPYLNWAPHETTLKAGQSQTIRIQRKAMAAAQDGEYVSHLMVQEMPDNTPTPKTTNENELKIDIQALYGVTIPVIIDKGPLTDTGSLSHVQIKQTDMGPQAVITIKRKGSKSFWADVIVMDGSNEIGRLNSIKIFLSTPERTVIVPLSKTPSKSARVILKDARTNEAVDQKQF